MGTPFSTLRLANELIRLGGLGAYQRFQSHSRKPREAQERWLSSMLRANQDSHYGKAHGFDRLRTPRDYQSAVPLVDHDDLKPWVERIMKGEHGVLTTEPVLMLEKTSGSTASSKYVPYTASLRREFQQATSAWLTDLLTRRPKLRDLGSYWSLSPAAQTREFTEGGLPIGFEDDTEYFGLIERWVLRQSILVPSEAARVPDMDTMRYLTLRFLLGDDRLGLISVWNPSFLTLLLREVPRHAEPLLRDLAQGTLTPPSPLPQALHQQLARGLRPNPARAADLKSCLQGDGQPLGTELWPNLQLISCWTEGMATHALPELERLFPGVEIQGKGLLATEGFVSFPLMGQPGAAIALDSHFFEFLPEGRTEPLLLHELEVGQRYEVVISTGGGFYRYRLQDVVQVVGRCQETPLITFVGKNDKVSDLVGEKLNELMVGQLLEEVLTAGGVRWRMMAPEWGDPPRYCLFLETDLSDEELGHVTELVERRLHENRHYAYARQLGQLGPLVGIRLSDHAEARYLAGCESLGQKVGNIKPCYLHKALGWRERLVAR